MLSSVDFHDPLTVANPYPTYEALQRLPPAHTRLGWCFTKYHDVTALLHDPALSSKRPEIDLELVRESERAAERRLREHAENWFLRMDHPEHTRLRRLTRQAFSAERTVAMRPRVETIVSELLDPVRDASEVDVITQLAYQLPTLVMAELMGVPQSDRKAFLAWTAGVEEAYNKGPDWSTHVARPARDVSGLDALCDYVGAMAEERRARPTGDFMSEMTSAQKDGDFMSTAEIVATCVMLIRTGRETTTNMIGNGLLALLQHPGEARRLKEDPSLLGSAIREFLRYDSPLQIEARTAAAPTRCGDVLIDTGDVVMLMIGAANRDAEVFSEPRRLDIARKERPHLSFGRGPHSCIAAQLALIQGEVAFENLLWKFPEMELTGDPLEYRPNPSLRGLKSLRVSLSGN
ncbi:cytochrome P450 [Streptomyces sp. NPDC001770]